MKYWIWICLELLIVFGTGVWVYFLPEDVLAKGVVGFGILCLVEECREINGRKTMEYKEGMTCGECLKYAFCPVANHNIYHKACMKITTKENYTIEQNAGENQNCAYEKAWGGRMKIYIAGKITGESRASVAEKFASAMCKLKSAGHLPFNPSVLPDYEDVDHEDYMHVCYAMIDICDAIYMLKDWQTSAGARAELQYAAEWKKKIMYEDESTREQGFPIVYGG